MAQVIVTETLELKRIEVDNNEPVTSVTVTDATEYDRVAISSVGDSITVVLSATAAGVSSVNNYTGAVTLTTTNINEGTNLYYTSSRANSDFDTRLATKSTTHLTEGANLYYTTARANSDFDTRLATKSTTNLAEGSNLYYTTARSNTDFDTRLATKSTSNLTEGTNLYYTDARVGSYLAANHYATQSYVGTQIANLVDSAPTTLDTLNELAAALGDDANFAATVTGALGTKLNTADFNATFDSRLATKTTTNLAEGTNLYYTAARVNSAFDTRLATKTTDNLPQGATNLYYDDSYVAAYLMTSPQAILGQTEINGTFTVADTASAVYLNVPLVQIGDGSTGGEQGIQFSNSASNLAIVSINAQGQLVWTSKPDADYSERFELPLHRRINYTGSGTSAQTIDSFARTDYRAAKYLITASYGGEYSVCEILVLNKITAADHVIYAEINSSAALATYSAALSGTNIVLRTTPVNNGTVFKFTRHMVEA